MWRKGNPHAVLVENSVEVPQKIKNRTTICSSYSTPGYLSKENENTNLKREMHPYVHCTIIYNSQDMEATYKDVTDTCITEYNSATKKNEILSFATTCTDLQGIILSEISKTEKDKYCMISLTCGNLKDKTNEQSHSNRVTGTENKQVVVRGEVDGGMREKDEGD